MKLVVETGAHAPHRITILFGEQDVNNQKHPPNTVKNGLWISFTNRQISMYLVMARIIVIDIYCLCPSCRQSIQLDNDY